MQGQFRPDHIPYRPDIDGLRALAVVSVLFFHAGVRPFDGGYVGVDVFFVISGYLIMSTLLADIRAGQFSTAQFYRRRIRRIFPALYVNALFCTLAGAVLFAPEAYVEFGKSLIAMALFASNMFFLQSLTDSYFATPTDTNLLLHTWSLAVEEQFYILLPLSLILLRRFRPQTMFAWLLIFVIASFSLSAWLVTVWPKGAFYLVASRAWELLLGSLLALRGATCIERRDLREIASCTGLSLILFAVFSFSRDTEFPGIAALVPTVGAALIIGGSTGEQSLIGRLLSARPIVGIGLMSYSLYLWHWPVIVFIKYFIIYKLSASMIVLAIALSFLFGFLSYRFVELPFRRMPLSKTMKGSFILGGLATSLATALIGVVIVSSHGLPQRLDAATRRLVEANTARAHDFPDHGECLNFIQHVHDERDIHFCAVGLDAAKRVLFIGDSHADMLRPVIRRLVEEKALHSYGALFAISAGCAPVTNFNRTSRSYRCPDFFRLAYHRAEASDIDTVFIAFSAWWDTPDIVYNLCLMKNGSCNRVPAGNDLVREVVADIRAHILTLRQLGKRVIIALPAPIYRPSLPQLEIRLAMLGRISPVLAEDRPPRRLDFFEMRGRLLTLAMETGSQLFDFRVSLCKHSDCVYAVDGVSIYADGAHVANSELGIFRDNLVATFR